MSQGKNHIIVQDTQSFASAAKKLISSTKIIHIGEPQILAYKESNPFKGAIEVKGISKMHMMGVDEEKTSQRHLSGKTVHFKLILSLLTLFLTKERI